MTANITRWRFMTANMIRIAVHVQGPMMVAIPEERHAKMKRSDPQSECRSRIRSEEENGGQCCNCQRSADLPHDSAPEIIEKLTATNAHQYQQVPSMPRDSGLPPIIEEAAMYTLADTNAVKKFSHRLAYETVLAFRSDRVPTARVTSENSIRLDSQHEPESSHHLGRCLRSCTCSGSSLSTFSSRDAGWKPRTCFFIISLTSH
jgi:hypothetical protein